MPKLEHAAPALRRVPLALARRFFQICTATAAQSIAEAELAPLEFSVMAYINKAGGEPGIDQSTLAARLGIDRNNTSLLVARLLAKGCSKRGSTPRIGGHACCGSRRATKSCTRACIHAPVPTRCASWTR